MNKSSEHTKSLGLLFKTSTFKVLVDGPITRFLKSEQVDIRTLVGSWAQHSTDVTKSTINCTLAHALYSGIVKTLGEEPTTHHITSYINDRLSGTNDPVTEEQLIEIINKEQNNNRYNRYLNTIYILPLDTLEFSLEETLRSARVDRKKVALPINDYGYGINDCRLAFYRIVNPETGRIEIANSVHDQGNGLLLPWQSYIDQGATTGYRDLFEADRSDSTGLNRVYVKWIRSTKLRPKIQHISESPTRIINNLHIKTLEKVTKSVVQEHFNKRLISVRGEYNLFSITILWGLWHARDYHLKAKIVERAALLLRKNPKLHTSIIEKCKSEWRFRHPEKITKNPLLKSKIADEVYVGRFIQKIIKPRRKNEQVGSEQSASSSPEREPRTTSTDNPTANRNVN